MALDYALFQWLNGFAGISPASDRLIVGLAEYVPVLLIVLGSIALLRSAPRIRTGARWLIDAIAAAILARSVVVALIWEAVGRERPFLANDITHLFVVNHPSFPSAHASFLFAFSTVVFLRNRLIGIGLYAGSLAVCAARVAAGVHYPSDILGGIVVGVGSGLGVALAAGLLRKKGAT